MLSKIYFLAAPLLSIAFAQSTTPSTNPATTTAAPSSSPSTISVFFPLSLAGATLNASVISADPVQTTFVFTAGAQTLTLTEGESTLLFTSEPATSSSGEHGATVNCALLGATSTAQIPATQADCTLVTALGGVLPITSSSILSGDEISYAPVTVTAGLAALEAAATATPASSVATTTSSHPNAAVKTGVPGLLAAVGMVGLGLL